MSDASFILVGYDDSPGAQTALAFAVEEARLRSARLRVVHVVQARSRAYAGVASSRLPTEAETRPEAEAMLRRAVEAVEAAGGAEVEVELAAGVPAEVLTRQAAGALLLVVGSRGLGGFRELLLGSVSHQVVQHAPCPVVVVRVPEPAAVPGQEPRGRFSSDDARRLGAAIGIDWQTAPFDVEQFRLGLEIELEHGLHDPRTDVTGDDPQLTAKIALAHLNEFPDYYTRLEQMEEQARRELGGD